MTRQERLELCKLSEESFGSRYAWLSYLRTPYYEVETVATNKTLVNRQIKVAKWRTLEQVVQMMTPKEVEVQNDTETIQPSTETIPIVESPQVPNGSDSN